MWTMKLPASLRLRPAMMRARFCDTRLTLHCTAVSRTTLLGAGYCDTCYRGVCSKSSLLLCWVLCAVTLAAEEFVTSGGSNDGVSTSDAKQQSGATQQQEAAWSLQNQSPEHQQYQQQQAVAARQAQMGSSQEPLAPVIEDHPGKLQTTQTQAQTQAHARAQAQPLAEAEAKAQGRRAGDPAPQAAVPSQGEAPLQIQETTSRSPESTGTPAVHQDAQQGYPAAGSGPGVGAGAGSHVSTGPGLGGTGGALANGGLVVGPGKGSAPVRSLSENRAPGPPAQLSTAAHPHKAQLAHVPVPAFAAPKGGVVQAPVAQAPQAAAKESSNQPQPQQRTGFLSKLGGAGIKGGGSGKEKRSVFSKYLGTHGDFRGCSLVMAWVVMCLRHAA